MLDILTLYSILGSTASTVSSAPYLEKLRAKLTKIAVHEKTIFDSYRKAIKYHLTESGKEQLLTFLNLQLIEIIKR
jgi:hypothetical protein